MKKYYFDYYEVLKLTVLLKQMRICELNQNLLQGTLSLALQVLPLSDLQCKKYCYGYK